MINSIAGRIDQLEKDKASFLKKVTDINAWILKHFDSPDRLKYISDRNYWQCKINTTERKIHHLSNGIPEHGYGIEGDVAFPDISTIHKSQK